MIAKCINFFSLFLSKIPFYFWIMAHIIISFSVFFIDGPSKTLSPHKITKRQKTQIYAVNNTIHFFFCYASIKWTSKSIKFVVFWFCIKWNFFLFRLSYHAKRIDNVTSVFFFFLISLTLDWNKEKNEFNPIIMYLLC